MRPQAKPSARNSATAGQAHLSPIRHNDLTPDRIARDASRDPAPHARTGDSVHRVSEVSSPEYAAELIFAAVVLALLAYFWTESTSGDITPSSGTGYMLGITGGLMMLATLLYPLRKFWKPLQRAGAVRIWFQVHMALGFLGPALVIIHSNFSLGSANGKVAMVVMLLIVASGIVRRYLYGKIFAGANEHGLDAVQLFADSGIVRVALGDSMSQAPRIDAQLASYEVDVKSRLRTLLGSLGVVISRRRSKRCFDSILRECDSVLAIRALREGWSTARLGRHRSQVENQLRSYFQTVERAARMHFLKRLFDLWHLLHLPLFLFLVMAVVGHVVAVHLY